MTFATLDHYASLAVVIGAALWLASLVWLTIRAVFAVPEIARALNRIADAFDTLNDGDDDDPERDDAFEDEGEDEPAGTVIDIVGRNNRAA